MDKLLIAVTKDAVAAAQVASVLVTVTFPCTIVGLRWMISFVQDAGTGTPTGYWAIIKVVDGNAPKTMGGSDQGVFYAPEQNVLAFGVFSIDNNTETKIFEGSTKTMRKMMGGDTLQFITIGTATNTFAVRGIVQFFCKT